MKKLILGAGLALITGFASAQQVGIKAGLNYTTFKGDDAKNYDYRPGYTVGVTARKEINNHIGIQPELLFTSKGAKTETTNGNTTSKEKTRLNYLDVPVLLSIQTSGLFFEVGPQISFLLKGTHTN
ncbi:porin family protein [Pontibacter silvestris]|uniref:Porin family protein n=1 Tax=Pontibacter silvestris TaxID=2305183 RepID=A0ABW4WTU4_9BACT|nr:porin family protein [Pontibacter silvestris]MCC9137840.1 PorT family protein [Pontibacter silvestris]